MSWLLLIHFMFVVVLVIAVLLVSYLLRQRLSEPTTGERYEGRIVFREGSACAFLLSVTTRSLDLEAISLFASGAVRDLGWPVMPWFCCS